MTTPDPYAACPCGSGKKFKFCCRSQPNTTDGESSAFPPMRDGTRFYPIRPEWLEGTLGAVLVNANWRDAGMAGICAIRRARGFVYGFCYLVDVYGLGLKGHCPVPPEKTLPS